MDSEKVVAHCEWAIKQSSLTIIEAKKFYEEVLALLKEKEEEIENMRELFIQSDHAMEIINNKLDDLIKRCESIDNSTTGKL